MGCSQWMNPNRRGLGKTQPTIVVEVGQEEESGSASRRSWPLETPSVQLSYSPTNPQALTFPSFGGVDVRVVSCAILGLQVGGRDPTLLFRCADKPPACTGDKREQAVNPCGMVEAGWGRDMDDRRGQRARL